MMSAAASPHLSPLPEGEGAIRAPAGLEITDEADDDDDLPRPGKVWSGPSLASMLNSSTLKSPAAGATPAPSTMPLAESDSVANIEPVDPSNLPAVWQRMLGLLASHGPVLNSLLAPGRLAAIEDGRALVRYAPQHETFVKMLERNGKKDLVREKLTEVLGQNIGVKFEVDALSVEPAAAAPGTPSSARNSAAVQRPTHAARPGGSASLVAADAAPNSASAVTPSVKLTPELIESLRANPLVKALMDQMGAQIVKVE